MNTGIQFKFMFLVPFGLFGSVSTDFDLLCFSFIAHKFLNENIFCDSESVTPTHIGAAHAFSKIQQNFLNRIPKESKQNFDIPRISVIN